MCATRALYAIALSCLVLLFRIHIEKTLISLVAGAVSSRFEWNSRLYSFRRLSFVRMVQHNAAKINTQDREWEWGTTGARTAYTHKMGICDISEAAAKQRWNNLWENISFWLLPFPPLLSCVVKICSFLQFSLLFMFGPKMKLFSLLIRENLLSSKFAS